MKLSPSSPTAGLAILLALLPFTTAVPKAPWVKQRAKGQARRALSAAMEARDTNSSTPECAEREALLTTAPKTNVWAGLDGEEASSVVHWLFAQEELNLTVMEDAGSWDNTLLLVELQTPNKTDALSYIDGSGPEPERWVRAVIDHKASEEPYIQDILVGPLPVVNGTTTWSPLEYTHTRKTEGKVRSLEADSEAYEEWLMQVSTSVADITMDLWNASALGLENDTLSVWGIDPYYQEEGRIKRWDTFWGMPEGLFEDMTLLPMGLFFMSDVTGRDPSKWTVEGWYYNGEFYETTDEFRDAYWGGKVEKLKGAVEGAWAQTDRQGKIPPLDTTAPPVMVAPGGARYHVDPESKYVEWMGWSFYVAFNRDSGMSLFDIRYKGQRLVYELGLMEALAHYAGSDPVQSHVAYLDTYYGFGPFAFELLKGFDCPSYASYLNTSFYVDETTHTHLNSICLFEGDADYPMSRHSSSAYVASTKNIYFTVRSVSTVGNYDYMFSYTFFMDGSLAIEVRASGYIQSAYYAKNEDYGFHIHDSLSGSMHDHVLLYKIDVDVLGTENTVQFMDQVPTTTKYPWSKDKVFDTMKLQRSFLENEDQGQFNWKANSQQQVFVVNQEEKNKYGELRGYRVLPYTGASHLTINNSSILKNAAKWAEHDIMVSVRKDSEPKGTHAFNNQDTENPPVDFSKFFDGESLNQTDLVLWVNLGMHHVPHTGDLPNTVFTTAHSGIQLMPSNYFEVGQNTETVNMVRVDYNDGVVSDVISFGSAEDTCSLDYEPVFVDLWEYKGDVVVRKLPYSPNDPYYDTDSI